MLLSVKYNGKTVVLVEDKLDLGYTSFYENDGRAVGEGKRKKEALVSLCKSYEFLNNQKNGRK